VGAAGELRVRQQLPGLSFPVDAEPDPDAEPKPTGEPAHVVRVNTAPDTRLEGPAALARVYAEEQGARRGRRWRVWLAVAVVVVLLLVAAFLSFGAWARGQWFVGESDGYVAVFNGVPGGIGPVSLHRVEEVSDLRVDQLPTFEAEQVQATVFAASQAAADETVLRLRARAQQCVTAPTTAGCPGATT
jgi:protein phosphatase